MPTPDQVAPHIVVSGGLAAAFIADALQPFSPCVTADADYLAAGIRVGTGYPGRLLDLAERANGIGAELDRLGLPEQREAVDLLERAAPGALFVINLDRETLLRPALRHRREDWLFALSLDELEADLLLDIDEAVLRAQVESGAVHAAAGSLAQVVAVGRHLKAAYEIVAPLSAQDIAWQVRSLAECIPQGAKLVIVVPGPAAGAPADAPVGDGMAACRDAILQVAHIYAYVGVIVADDAVAGAARGDGAAASVLAAQIAGAAQALPVRADMPLSRRRLRRILEEQRARAVFAAQAADYARASFEALLRTDAETDAVDRIARSLATGETSFAGHLRALAASEAFVARWAARQAADAAQAASGAAEPPVAAEAQVAADAAVTADTAATAEAPPPQPVKINIIPARVLRVPQELQVTETHPKRALIIGSCLSAGIARRMQLLPEPCESDLFFLGGDLPAEPPRPVAEYDFQLVQLGLRFVVPDTAFAKIAQSNEAEHEKLFARASAMLLRHFELAMRWNAEHGLLTFVVPFLVPSQNPVGRLLPRYEMRNAVYLIERLNQLLADQTERYTNAYFIDLNEIHAFYGKRYTQDDILTQFNHNNLIGNADAKHDTGRLEDAGRATDFFAERIGESFHAFWNEIIGAFRTVRQIDQVKMVVVDLDDTLWRGVLGEQDLENLPTSEGWPKGLWEALLILKRRGILLGIISKNDEQRIVCAWDKVFRKHMELSDFVAREINWQPKPDNLQKILAAVNLLPRNVLYIDDNPVERAAMQAAFPELRVLGGSPLLWRRILLWAPETQVATITAESAVRTDMVRAQMTREQDRQSMSRDDFLASLGVRMSVTEITGIDHPRFPRTLELINKTNQFNTTGRRWLLEDCKAHFAAGHAMLAFDVADQYTEYGLVGVLVLRGGAIAQFVMSCRVLGLGIEAAAVALAGQWLIRNGAAEISAALVETERNQPCRDVYALCGFSQKGSDWVRSAEDWMAWPEHIAVNGGWLLEPESEKKVA